MGGGGGERESKLCIIVRVVDKVPVLHQFKIPEPVICFPDFAYVSPSNF